MSAVSIPGDLAKQHLYISALSLHCGSLLLYISTLIQVKSEEDRRTIARLKAQLQAAQARHQVGAKSGIVRLSD